MIPDHAARAARIVCWLAGTNSDDGLGTHSDDLLVTLTDVTWAGVGSGVDLEEVIAWQPDVHEQPIPSGHGDSHRRPARG